MDPIERLKQAWQGPRTPLAAWVRATEDAYRSTRLSILDAAERIDATGAELEAVLRLALFDDDTLQVISRANPPMTTWLLLAELPTDSIAAVLEAEQRDSSVSSEYQRMESAVRQVLGRASLSTVQTLPAELFDFANKKAKAYSVWAAKSKHHGALAGFARRRKAGRPLSPGQTAYARDLLAQIVEAGAIAVPSPDGDDELCEQVLAAIA